MKRSESSKNPLPKGSGEATVSARTKPGIYILLIIVVGFLVYSNTFWAPFLFDDENNIYKNMAIRDAGYFLKVSVTDLLVGSRLVGQITFALNYAVHGLDVVGYHVVNLVIHLSCALLVYWLVALTFRTPYISDYRQRSEDRSLTLPRLAALCVALLFVSHPVQTQAVTYIVQRHASLATLFYLFSLVMYIKFRFAEPLRKRYAFYAASIFSAVLAMKTKEIAFTLPAMIALYEFMFFSGNRRRRFLYLVPVILTMLVIPLSLIVAQGPSLGEAGGIDELTKVAGVPDISRWDYLNTQFRVVVTYIRLLLLPVNQNLDYDYPIYRTFFTPPVSFSFLFLLSVVGLGVYLFNRSSRSATEGGYWFRLMAFGIFWFFVTLSVESSIIPIADVIFEHRLYLPSVGFVMVVTAGVMWIWNRMEDKSFGAKAVPVVMVLIVLGLSATTYARNQTWQDEVTLWEDTVKKSPQKARPLYNLHDSRGRFHIQHRNYDDALREFQMAIEINPYFADAHNNLGLIYLQKGRIDESIKEIRNALALEPNSGYIHDSLGQIYLAQGRSEEAMRAFQLALRLDPNCAEARDNLKKVSELIEKKIRDRK